MAKIKGWSKTVDNEYISTGGGFDYYITFYRHNDGIHQIEIFNEVDRWGKRLKPASVNIGRLYEKNVDKYDFIQGDYTFVKTFKDFETAKKFVIKYMRSHPNG